jgi:peptide/nickel transport system substrate-binding protein/oligopeptide transport system substrate-binding protein
LSVKRRTGGGDATCNNTSRPLGKEIRRARIRLTLFRAEGNFSRLRRAVNCLHQNIMRRSARVAAALLLTACGGASGGDRKTIVDSRDIYDPRSLDPALSTDVPTGRAVGYLFDGLTRFTPAGDVVPALATKWDVSPDGITYTFHLRRGVQFTDGTPFLARQVVKSWQRVLDPKVKGGRGWPLYPIKGAKEFADGKSATFDGVTAPNDSTVIVTLKEPFAIFPKLLAMPVASIAPDNIPANFGENPVGTGPWRLIEWKHDDYLLFAPNAKYWGGAPKADSLKARIIAEPSTAVAEFESGNVDVLQIPQSEIINWQEDTERRKLLMSTPSLELVYVAINTTRGPLRDVRVRQALNHAIDRRALVKNLVAGRGILAAGVIPFSLPGSDSTRVGYQFDTLRARQLLREAGYPNGIDLDLWTSTNPTYVRIAETLQGYFQLSGIRLKIIQRESAAAREAARKGQADLFVKDWYADYPDAENFLYPLLHSANKGVGGNVSFYGNPQYDSLVSQARREQDESKRIAMYREADEMAFKDAPMIFLYFYSELYAVQPWLKGFVPPTIFNGQPWLDVTKVVTSSAAAR